MAEFVKLYEDNPQPRVLEQIKEILLNGGVIIYPTDGVYAIGCDLRQPKAMERVAQIRGMQLKKAEFSIIFYDLSHLSDYTLQVDTPTYKILKRALPGPYTFILEANSTVPKLFKHKKKTIGIRIPDNNIPRHIVRHLDSPIIATSVHDDDEIMEYTTDPELIFEKYQNQVDMVIDGGMGSLYASTVIDLTQGKREVIREGQGAIDFL